MKRPEDHRNKTAMWLGCSRTSSVRYAIGMIDFSKEESLWQITLLPVCSHVDGKEVSEDMMRGQIHALNKTSRLHGQTGKRLEKKGLVFSLHRYNKQP